MIIVDTSVWIDHLRSPDATLSVALTETRVLQHPFVTAELALGSLANREEFLALLQCLPQAEIVDEGTLLAFVDDHDLAGTGLGAVDAYLLASAVLFEQRELMTNDRRLSDQARRLGVEAGGHNA